MTKKLLAGIVAAILSGSLLAGCGGNSAEGVGGTPGDLGEAGSGELVSDGVDRDATIKVANIYPLSTTDPHAPGSGPNISYLPMLYDGLFRATDEGVSGQLVEKWEFVDDALVLTLRDDGRFHDGSPIDAEAVKANLDRLRGAEDSGYVLDYASVKSVEAVDEVTVKVNLAPDRGAGLPHVMTGMAGLMVNPKFFDNAEALRTSAPDGAGSGPYKIESWTPGENHVVFVRAGDHWDPTAGLAARIEVDVLAPDQALDAVETGQYDIAGTNVAPQDVIRRAEASPDLEANFPQVLYPQSMWLQDNPDPTIRQAMALAIDREAIVALFGQGTAATNQVYPEDSPLYVDEADELHTYDPERAKELVDSVPESSRTVSIVARSSDPESQVIELVQAQLAAVGITLNVEEREGAALYETWHGGEVDALFSATTTSPYGATTIISDTRPGSGIRGAPEDAQPEIEAELARADNPALGEEERNEIFKAVLLRAAEEYWWLTLYIQRPASLASADIVNDDVGLEYWHTNLRHLGKTAS